jgi:hypothetical protein
VPNNTDAQITRAIVSVSDKSGLLSLGQALARHNIEVLSTGGSKPCTLKSMVAFWPAAITPKTKPQ